ncbi:SpoIIE family protein phosphatase [Fundidesulfovibrio terrae]|uniref:SpoIIE family protein phosphatase n=1 Tax=Fundidesulfovibrio terrae TaxID=2922866 RepID=UPI001FAFABD2|nr:SpoIIE family protein phosphatase [Fundidesulfovibrio terrae]
MPHDPSSPLAPPAQSAARDLLPLARALAASEALASLVLDRSGRVLSASPGAASLFGLPGPPPPGQPAVELLPGQSRASFLELLRVAQELGEARTALLRLGGTDDQPRMAAASMLPVPGGEPGEDAPALAFLARDITGEHEQTERLRRGTLEVIRLNAELRTMSVSRELALQSLEELSGRLKGVLEAASRVVIVAISQSGIITMFNPGAANLLGFAAAEMEGLETPLAFLDEEELSARGKALGLADGRTYAGVGVVMALARSGRRDSGEWTLVRKDGGRFAAELALSAIEGPHGVEGYLIVGVDVSGRKQAEEAMREREARLRAILDGAADGIITVERGGRIETLNRAAEAMFGYTSAEMAGRSLDLIAPAALNAPPPRAGASAREVMGLRQDGTGFPMELSMSTVDLPSRTISICIVRDITARRKAEEAQRLFTRRLAEQQASLERDLKAAAEIQKSLLPKDLAPDSRYEARWLFEPSATIGGDIFNILTLGPDHIGAYMLDVSGHGVPSALVAAAAAQALQFHSRAGYGPDKVLAALDAEFPLTRFDRYFSMFYCIADLEAGSISYSNAGHPPPLLVRASGGVEELDAGGTVVGLGGLLPFEIGLVEVRPGDMLAVYTDGLTEFEDRRGRRFGVKRLRRWLDGCAGLGADEALSGLRREIKAFGGKASPQDDLSVLLVRFGRGIPPDGRNP